MREQAELAKQKALELNDRATQYQILAREVETNKGIHQSLLQRVKEIDATVGADISNIQVVDHSLLPVEPDKPRIKLNLLLAIGIGLMLGVAAAFLLEFLDNTVKSMDEISDRFGITILGVLPKRKINTGTSSIPLWCPSRGLASPKPSARPACPSSSPPRPREARAPCS